MTMNSYSTDQVVQHAEVPPNFLRGLVDAGAIVPDVASEVGRGRERRYSFRNIFEVAVACELRRFDVSTAHVHRVLTFLRSLDDAGTSDPELAERWTRFRSWDTPAHAVLFFRADRLAPTFHFVVAGGASLPVGFRGKVPAWLVIDIASIYVKLTRKAGEKWPADLRRPLDDDLWDQIEARDDAHREQLEIEQLAAARATVRAAEQATTA